MQRFDWLARHETRRCRSHSASTLTSPLARRLHVEQLEDRRMLATIMVDSPLDNFDPGAPTTDGVITLREAIIAANTDAATGDAPAGSGVDTIAFDTAGAFATQQTILLSFGEYEITEALTIDGPGQNLLTIDAQQNSRIFNINSAVGDFTVRGLKLVNGKSTGDNASASDNTFSGGAIRSVTAGQFTVEETKIISSIADGAFVRGGGIFSQGPVSLTDSTITGSFVQDLVGFTNAHGGGISTDGFLSITGSSITDNGGFFFGGGIHSTAPIEVTDSTISGNAPNGIFAEDTVTLTRTTVSNNLAFAAGGGILGDEVILIDSTVSGNTVESTNGSAWGGGIRANDVMLTRSTVSGNTVTSEVDVGPVHPNALGGGIYADTVTLMQSTVSGNAVNNLSVDYSLDNDAEGGGIHAYAVTLMQSTVAYNTAYSLDGDSRRAGIVGRGGPVVITGSIVAGQIGSIATGLDVSKSDLDSGGGALTVTHSLIGVNTLSGLAGSGTPDANGNLIGDLGPFGPIFPLFDALADNGGPTQTHALTAFSPAIDAGDPSIIFSPTEFDQRGDPFVRVFDGEGDSTPRIDMGAYERNSLDVVTVDSATDESDGDYSTGDVSLREAVLLASFSLDDSEIFFDSTVFDTPQTIPLTLGGMDTGFLFDNSLTIHGPGQDLLTIDAQQNSRIFDTPSNFTSDFTIEKLTLTGGLTDSSGFNVGPGGAIRFGSSGNLTINESTITGSSTTASGTPGGAIYSTGPVYLNDSTISGNSATGPGGGIFTKGFGHVTLTNSTVSGNSTSGYEAYGGGIAASAAGNVTLTQSTVSGNHTSGERGFGGGIYADQGDVTLVESTVSENYTTGLSAEGGGIFANGSVSLTQSTVSGNYTSGDDISGGAGIRASTVTLDYSTLTENHVAYLSASGAGIWSFNGTLVITGSIVAGNTVGGGFDDIDQGGGTLSVNYSLIGMNVAPDVGTSGNNVVTDTPILGPLADNGGPTETRVPLAGSEAIDMGDMNAVAGVGNVPFYDQRSLAFSRVVGGRIDIGAVESGAISGNFDSNTVINGIDFLAWQRGFGIVTPNASPADGDADLDQDVDEIDFGIWEDQFGEAVAPLAAASSPSRASLIDAAIAMEQMELEQEDLEPPVVEEEQVREAFFGRSYRSDILQSESRHYSIHAATNAGLTKRDEVVVEALREEVVDTLFARTFG